MAQSTYPSVYQAGLEQSNIEELLQFYASEILRDACSGNVESTLTNYITRTVEPVGWKAIWRATTNSSQLPYECDFLVEVMDVSLCHLEADVVIKKILCCTDPLTNEDKDSQELNLIGQSKTALLIELYPVCEEDDEEQFIETAIAIEYVRFFYKNIWRPWDDENDDEDVFMEKYFSPRLKLYFDIKNKILPEALVIRATDITKEGWNLKKQLSDLLDEMNVSDSEAELNEKDILRTMQLRMKLENLQREMEMIEDPLIRSLLLKKDFALKSPLKAQRKESEPVTHLVSEQFTFGMLKDVMLDPKTVVKFSSSLFAAMGDACSGDEILIFPGRYKCDAFDWFEEQVTIKGLGAEGEVILEAAGNGDIFINCNSPKLVLNNLVLRPSNSMMCTVLVHFGVLEMNNCTIEGVASNCCITVLEGAEGKLANCKILHSKGDGIQLRTFGTLSLKSCSIFGCQGNGLQIWGDETPKNPTETTTLNLCQTCIYKNEGYAINVTVTDESCEIPKVEEATEAVLTSFPWLTATISDLTLHDNKGDVSITSSQKIDTLFKMAGVKKYITEDSFTDVGNVLDLNLNDNWSN